MTESSIKYDGSNINIVVSFRFTEYDRLCLFRRKITIKLVPIEQGNINEKDRVASQCTFTIYLNPQYTDGLFHCYMLDETICHLRVVGSILSLLFNV